MKRILYSFLAITLLAGLVLSVSCSCEKDDMPQGVVLRFLSGKTDVYKDYNNVIVYPIEKPQDYPGKGPDDFYRKIECTAFVKNIGADGVVIFHASCDADDVLGRNQDTRSFFLEKDAEVFIDFIFWIRGDYGQEAILVQAVNVSDFVDE